MRYREQNHALTNDAAACEDCRLAAAEHVRVPSLKLLQHTRAAWLAAHRHTLLVLLLLCLLHACCVRSVVATGSQVTVPHCARSQSTLLLLITHLLCKSCTRRVQVMEWFRVIHTGGGVMHVVKRCPPEWLSV